jgi:hypothetical protein
MMNTLRTVLAILSPGPRGIARAAVPMVGGPRRFEATTGRRWGGRSGEDERGRPTEAAFSSGGDQQHDG